MRKKIKCSILTPEKYLYEGEADFAVVQAYDGEMGFLINHTPLITQLGYGEIRLRNGDKTDYLVVEGGLVEIFDNKMNILAENAFTKDELDSDEISKKIREIRENRIDPFSEEGLILSAEEHKLKIRLKVAKR